MAAASYNRFAQALGALMPLGAAWPRATDSTQASTVRGMAWAFSQLHDWTDWQVMQWQPGTTRMRLGEWETAVGLPESWTPAGLTESQRRARVLARLRGVALPHADSSPAAVGVLSALLATVGYSVTMRYNTPARCGVARCGDHLGALDGVLWITVANSGSNPARVGTARCGDRLISRALDTTELLGMLDRVLPARFTYQLILS